MTTLLIIVIYLIFISLGLPDSLLGSGWVSMHVSFDVPLSYAGYVSMTISFMTIISALICPKLMKKLETKWIVIISIFLTVMGLVGFYKCDQYYKLFLWAIPFGLGAGSIDASINSFVANNYSSRVMNFLHCFYGLGAVISPNIMALALKYAKWNQGYLWVAYLQIIILIIVLLTLTIWPVENKNNQDEIINTGIYETIKRKGVIFTLLAFLAYCAGESICFLWTSSYFSSSFNNISPELIASFGSLSFGGLMIGRVISGIICNKFNDRQLIRMGTVLEIIGITLIILSFNSYIISALGFLMVGIGMGPIYPSIQHMAPINFGKEYADTVISLQMAFAYIGSTFMPSFFGIVSEKFGIYLLPFFILILAIICLLMLEITYKLVKKD